jgi:hypothetical protein
MNKRTTIAAAILAAGLGLSGCAALNSALKTACDEALPLAELTKLIPVVGEYVAAGVQIGCGTSEGLARLAADPGSSAWVGRQTQMMTEALKR